MVFIYPRYVWGSWASRIAGCAVLAVAFYIDTQYIRMTMRESDQFVERSGLYGDWRARQKNYKAVVDNETIGE